MWLHLQSGFLRSPVATDSARQLLIVGTQSSGTTGTADGLQRLGLEVSHESSDATWSFARDGTVSWLHGLRFLRRPSDVDEHAASIRALCATFRPSMGFHPAMFRVPRRGCSYRSKWDGCWRAECIDIVAAEWGCALAEGGARCETPFAASLLQVRHPLRTIESLAVKFCPSLDDAAHPHLSAFLRAILPEAGWPAGAGSCLETMGWFWARYNAAMLDAHEARAFITRKRSRDPPVRARAMTLAGWHRCAGGRHSGLVPCRGRERMQHRRPRRVAAAKHLAGAARPPTGCRGVQTSARGRRSGDTSASQSTQPRSSDCQQHLTAALGGGGRARAGSEAGL